MQNNVKYSWACLYRCKFKVSEQFAQVNDRKVQAVTVIVEDNDF